MRQIPDEAALSALLQARLRPGLRANGPLDAARYAADLEAGTLYGEEFQGGLYLLRRRDGFGRLSFFLLPGAVPPAPSWPDPVVLEAARRAGRGGEDWSGAGFARLFSRSRLTRREAPVLPAPLAPRAAEAEDLPLVQGILYACYDPMTACLPTEAELMAEIRSKQLLLLEEEQALVHFCPCPGGTEVRHIAVMPHRRRHGAAQSLLTAYLSDHGAGTCRVWITDTNLASRGLFQKNGYQPDGWVSEVWKKLPK